MLDDFLARWQHTIATAFHVVAILLLFRVSRWTLVRAVYASILVSILARRILGTMGDGVWDTLEDALMVYNSIGFIFVSWEVGQISRRER